MEIQTSHSICMFVPSQSNGTCVWEEAQWSQLTLTFPNGRGQHHLAFCLLLFRMALIEEPRSRFLFSPGGFVFISIKRASERSQEERVRVTLNVLFLRTGSQCWSCPLALQADFICPFNWQILCTRKWLS